MSDENKRALQEHHAAAQEREAAANARREVRHEHQEAAKARDENRTGWNHAQNDRDCSPSFIIRLTLLATMKTKILNWLSRGDFNARHSTIAETHAEGTGTWLLDSLQRWFDGTGPRLVVCKGAGTFYRRSWLIFSGRREDIFDVRM